MVIQVAKAELRNLFYSPIAWFMLIAFLVQCGWYYSTPLESFAHWQDILLRNNPETDAFDKLSYTRALFIGDEGFFSNVLKNLYLFLPLLTMGLIGREVQNGTIKLLYSSPVTIRQIVTGKFLAFMVFNGLLVLIVGIFCVSAAIQVKSMDYGMLLSSMLGFYLLACTYGAIGAFMSSITTYQVVSAFSTFLVVLLLTFIGNVWQQYDFVRDLTFFLHLPGRTEKMLVGLITTKDVIYFLVVITIFLLFTILKLRGARETSPWYVKASRYMGVLAAGLLIGYITSRPALTGYWDTTAQKVNTLHPKTQELIREMGDEPLEVTLYVNYMGRGANAGLPAARNFYLSWVWEQYTRFKPDIKFNFEYYYDHDSTFMGNHIYKRFPGKSLEQILLKMGEYTDADVSYFQKPEEMRKKIDLRPEGLALVMQLKYKGRTEFLRTYNDSKLWPSENNFAAVFKKLLHPEKIPHIAFVTGHYERNIYKLGEREIGNHTAIKESRVALVNYGYNMDSLSLDHNDIPANTTLLVLPDPKTELSESCRTRIRQYIDGGGNMFILGEPGKQQVLNPVLQQIGVKLEDGIILTEYKQEAQDMVVPSINMAMLSLMEDPSAAVFKKVKPKHTNLVMPGVAALQVADSNSFTSSALLATDKKITWIRKGVFVRDSAKLQFNAAEGDLRSAPSFGDAFQVIQASNNTAQDQKKPEDNHVSNDGDGFATMLAMHRNVRNKDQRILVAGDADFLSNIRSLQVGKYANYFYSWLSNGEFPVYLPGNPPPDNHLNVGPVTAKTLRVIYIYVLPGAVLLFATLLLIRRKRK
ncbi:MAG: Gldg family protein [Pseudobacter sp.]|uniref:Gldg family protein n=1 Tax=Pseudobacter sp. TaxID=2045420 RepID=UPI003F7FC970